MNGITKPDSDRIESFIDGFVQKVSVGLPSYNQEGYPQLNLSDPHKLRRVLKDGVYGVLWGYFSSKGRSEELERLRKREKELMDELSRRPK